MDSVFEGWDRLQLFQSDSSVVCMMPRSPSRPSLFLLCDDRIQCKLADGYE